MNDLFKTVITAGLAMSSAMLAANDFLPMQVNDSKVFASNDTEATVKIVETSGANWKKYSSFMGKSQQWVWSSENNQKIYWHNNGNTQLLVDFSQPVGSVFTANIDECTSKAMIAEKTYTSTTSAGKFANATRLTFSGNCADAGLKEAVFVPRVGLVSYTHQSIVGPVYSELKRANIAGVSYPLHLGIAVATEFPSGRIMSNERNSVSAYLTLENRSDKTEVFQFNSSQTFDISILTVDGTVLNTWSANKRFAMALHSIELAPGESRRFGGDIALTDFNGQTLDVGSYRLRITITGSNQPQASAFSGVRYSAESPLYIDQRMTINPK